MAFAFATSAAPEPHNEIGKNNSGSADRHAASDRQPEWSSIAVIAFLAADSSRNMDP
jgi:hypothetical protein